MRRAGGGSTLGTHWRPPTAGDMAASGDGSRRGGAYIDVVLREPGAAIGADDEGPAEAASIHRDLNAVLHEDDGREFGEEAAAAREAEAVHKRVWPGVNAEDVAVEQHEGRADGAREAARVHSGHGLHAQHVGEPAPRAAGGSQGCGLLCVWSWEDRPAELLPMHGSIVGGMQEAGHCDAPAESPRLYCWDADLKVSG